MSSSIPTFKRQANPLAMVFRLSFIHALYAAPAWYILRDFSRDSIPGFLSVFFSTFILVMVLLIRLRRFLNSRTERRVNRAETVAGEVLTVEQSFRFRDYLNLNTQVMFSYLRPWLTVLSGIIFLGLTFLGIRNGLDNVRIGMSGMLSAYFLLFPWLIFVFRVRRAYHRGKAAMDSQILEFQLGSIKVTIGEAGERVITTLSDIALTPDFILLFAVGSNYIQVCRDGLDDDSEDLILLTARKLLPVA